VGDASGGQLTFVQYNTSYTGTFAGVNLAKLKLIIDNSAAGNSNGLMLASPNSIYMAPGFSVVGTFASTGLSITGTLSVTGTITGTVTNLTNFTAATQANPLAADSPATLDAIGYVNADISLFSQADGGLYVAGYSTSWYHQIFGDFRTGQIAIRGKNNGTWQAFRTVLDSTNYTTYAGYGAKAWVNFNGTGTVAIRASANVSSITDNAVGDYTVNFTTAMADANYAFLAQAGNGDTSLQTAGTSFSGAAPTTTAARFLVDNGAGTLQDREYVMCAVFR
jgi:hypothetical protein